MKLGARVLSALKEMAGEQPLRIRVIGRSMEPSLAEGTWVEVSKARFYWPGDVIAFRDGHKQLVLHRLIGYWPRFSPAAALRLVTQGDACSSTDAPIPFSAVLGKAGKATLRQRLAAGSRLFRLLIERLRIRLAQSGH